MNIDEKKPKDIRTEVLGRFEKDIADHTMRVLLDQGVYRHLRFQKHGSSGHWFELVTWPGHLSITGDMGSFTFARLEDMFQFFRTERGVGPTEINPGYWAEKIEAANKSLSRKSNGITEFDLSKFKGHVIEDGAALARDLRARGFDRDSIREMIAELRSIADNHYDDEWQAFEAADVWSFEAKKGRLPGAIRTKKVYLDDFFENNCRSCTFHYIWCLYAIVWGIRKYDETRAQSAPNQHIDRLEQQRAALVEALKMAVRQNSHDMLMTGDEIRECNAALRAAEVVP